jgi:hypothetical protein
MNLPDRLFCLLLGHTWEIVPGRDAKRCAHCETDMNAIQLISYWRRHVHVWTGHITADGLPLTRRIGSDLPASQALRMGWPKRVWRVR